MRVLYRSFVALFILAALAQGIGAQQGVSVEVQETGGIGRTSFPARAVIDVPAGRLTPTDPLRFTSGDAEVPLQMTIRGSWNDGSVRTLEIDFNVSIAPFESKSFRLLFGQEPAAQAVNARGLSLTEDAEAFQAGRIRLGRSGSPLLTSVDYRGELITEGANGLEILDDAGVRHPASQIGWGPVEVRKQGPLTVHLRYEGDLELSSGGRVGVAVDVEMPNGKSWAKLAAVVSDPDRQVREIAIHTPVHLGDYPWTWDFATLNGTYGAFRDAAGSVVLTQTIDEGDTGSWEVRSGPAGEEQPYERS